MKNLVIGLAVVAGLAVAIGSGPASAQWYDGGTLQRATLSQWKAGSSANRLASAADLAAAFWQTKPDWQTRFRSMSQLRPYANQLNTCITIVANGSGSGSMRVPEVASSCIIQLGWR
ncbi:MAG: hypothetical protein RKK11_01250 [Alphaproteobacteria bacterium]